MHEQTEEIEEKWKHCHETSDLVHLRNCDCFYGCAAEVEVETEKRYADQIAKLEADCTRMRKVLSVFYAQCFSDNIVRPTSAEIRCALESGQSPLDKLSEQEKEIDRLKQEVREQTWKEATMKAAEMAGSYYWHQGMKLTILSLPCPPLLKEKEKPGWCRHIVWDKEREWWKFYDVPILHNAIVVNALDICPVAGCHAPRPKEKK